MLPCHLDILVNITLVSKFSSLWPTFELSFHRLLKILYWLYVARDHSFDPDSLSSIPFVGDGHGIYLAVLKCIYFPISPALQGVPPSRDWTALDFAC